MKDLKNSSFREKFILSVSKAYFSHPWISSLPLNLLILYVSLSSVTRSPASKWMVVNLAVSDLLILGHALIIIMSETKLKIKFSNNFSCKVKGWILWNHIRFFRFLQKCFKIKRISKKSKFSTIVQNNFQFSKLLEIYKNQSFLIFETVWKKGKLYEKWNFCKKTETFSTLFIC